MARSASTALVRLVGSIATRCAGNECALPLISPEKKKEQRHTI